jgi:hypothetical protein
MGNTTNGDNTIMTMNFLSVLAENWQAIAAGMIIAMASAGKVIELGIKTAGNVRDSWVETFGPQRWK